MDKVPKRLASEPLPSLAPAQDGAAGVQVGIRLTEQQARARRARSIAIALALGAFVVVIFVVTLVKLRSGVLTQPM